jgi:FMN phosphatase YigB (HAD superfamily)
MTIRGVTFDWWGTIARIPAREESGAMRTLRLGRLEAMFHGHGLRPSPTTLLEAYERQGELLEAMWDEHREPSPEDQVRAFARFAGLNGIAKGVLEGIGEAMGGAIVVRPPDLFAGIEGTLKELSARGLSIGLISNTGRSWGRYLTEVQRGAGIGSYFRARAYSDEIGVRKPDRRIFEVALRGLGLPGHEVVHVGDDVSADIAGAKAAGMRAVWFNTGFWEGATTDRADAEIRGLPDLPKVLEGIR